jgi:hypothetical protein
MGRVPNLVLKTIIEEVKETFQVPHLKVSEDTIKTRLKRSKQKEENACELDVLLAKTHIIPPSHQTTQKTESSQKSDYAELDINLGDRLIFCCVDRPISRTENIVEPLKPLYWPAILFLNYSEYQVYLQNQLAPQSTAHTTALVVFHNSWEDDDHRCLATHPLLALCLGKKADDNDRLTILYNTEQFVTYWAGLVPAIKICCDTSLHTSKEQHLAFARGIDEGHILIRLAVAPDLLMVQFAKRAINKAGFVDSYGDPEIETTDSFDTAWTKLQFLGFTEYRNIGSNEKLFVCPGASGHDGVVGLDYFNTEGMEVFLRATFGLGLRLP